MSIVNFQDETFKSFLVEMGESLQSMEESISELEKSYDIQVINSLFRSVHTIKGGAGFFELNKVQDLRKLKSGELNKLNIEVNKKYLKQNTKKGIF